MNQKVGRNDPCPCGSGKKYKSCCMLKEKSAAKYTASGKRKFKARVISTTDKSLSVFSRSASAPEIPTDSDALQRLKLRMTDKDFRQKAESQKEEKLPFNIPKSGEYEGGEVPQERERKVPAPNEPFEPTKEDFRKKQE